ncbi:hypothetical protein ALC62_01935 [Cyphomyrmex costatus]|uniref:Uncharacterized protein n=1 Tax=Cyphomyrmex costatus TaxID=456900 RepID=A0A151INS5_9HYME|nr:hypothetical protein ALC62_01935 [Cyphomyrmex costatus]
MPCYRKFDQRNRQTDDDLPSAEIANRDLHSVHICVRSDMIILTVRNLFGIHMSYNLRKPSFLFAFINSLHVNHKMHANLETSRRQPSISGAATYIDILLRRLERSVLPFKLPCLRRAIQIYSNVDVRTRQNKRLKF